jgi:light-regulated signal transduction histidine kinase (bacteriophytochrome)
MTPAWANHSVEELRKSLALLQEELAKTNQEVLLLTLELESRVESRMAELRVTQEQLQSTNAELRRLTAELEHRVFQRTAELEEANRALIEEINERREAEAKVQVANQALRLANADLEQFAYSASHDLQEPLRMVSIYSQMLNKKYGSKLDTQADRYLAYMVEGATRMEHLISDLLAYTQLAGTHEEIAGVADAADVLQSALSSLQVAIEQNHAVITNGALPRVRMQAVHLQQVFQNLLGNAIKYRGKEPPKIQIHARRDGDEWIFTLKDNGIGIDERYASAIFGIFKRLHSTAEYSGTGMGLAICKRIVQRYGGRIWVESKLGSGSTFAFTIRDGGSYEVAQH